MSPETPPPSAMAIAAEQAERKHAAATEHVAAAAMAKEQAALERASAAATTAATAAMEHIRAALAILDDKRTVVVDLKHEATAARTAPPHCTLRATAPTSATMTLIPIMKLPSSPTSTLKLRVSRTSAPLCQWSSIPYPPTTADGTTWCC